MADPMFDNLTRTIRGDAAPASMRFWIGKNLVLQDPRKDSKYDPAQRAIFCGGPDDLRG